METSFRPQFNASFDVKNHEGMYEQMVKDFNHHLPFRIAESPLFYDDKIVAKLMEAVDDITDYIVSDRFRSESEGVFDISKIKVPNEPEKPSFLVMDFGISIDENGDSFPNLIELQGFPSLYFFQAYLADLYRSNFDIPSDLDIYLNGNTQEDYKSILHKLIVGDADSKEVVMLEIEPEQQNTYIDFLCTEKALGIKILCISKVLREGRSLFYLNELGERVKIKRIYNRVIFDELLARPDLKLEYDLTTEVDVDWAGHPNWFFRISKFTLPFLKSKYVPECHFLKDVDLTMINLQDYVLKPLFSFSGAGVIIDIDENSINDIDNPKNYILQRKVTYSPVIETVDEPSKCEIRILMLWPKENERPIAIANLVRLSKGKMVGVKYNKDKTWVGGSVGFVKKP
jgi:hypothetical protein